jgi:hypothetical protein
MRTGISITITPSVRDRLEANTRDRNASQKHAWRAAIILMRAGVGTIDSPRCIAVAYADATLHCESA